MPPLVCNPDLWPFDLETGVRVASKVGNHSKFGHARPLGSRIIRYVRDGRTRRQTDRQTDGRTDRRTDKNNAYCPFLTVGGIINWNIRVSDQQVSIMLCSPQRIVWRGHSVSGLDGTSGWNRVIDRWNSLDQNTVDAPAWTVSKID